MGKNYLLWSIGIAFALLLSFLIGVATALTYPQKCYDLFIDKEGYSYTNYGIQKR